MIMDKKKILSIVLKVVMYALGLLTGVSASAFDVFQL